MSDRCPLGYLFLLLMLCHLNLIPSFGFVLSNHYMPLYVLLCGPKIRNKYLVSCILVHTLGQKKIYMCFRFQAEKN